VLVPAFDEAALLEATLAAIEAHCESRPEPFELVVVDDGSTDATPEIIAAFASTRPSVRTVTHPVNAGLGAALRSGIEAANAPVVVVLDADLTYAPDHIDPLRSACAAGAAIAVASPYAAGGRVSGVPWHRLGLSRLANRILRRRFGVATSTSMVRAYDRSFALGALGSLDDGDVLLGLLGAARAAGRTITEVPAHLDWRAVQDRHSRLRTGSAIRAVLRAWVRVRREDA